jgi:hypothetical protein
MQTDGHLVLRTPTRKVWDSATASPGAELQFASNGALAIRSATGAAIWSPGVGGATALKVEDSGALDLFRGGAVTWSAVGTGLRIGEALIAGDVVYSADHRLRLTMQGDGNLVLRSPTRVVWSTGTAGRTGAYLLLQTDGNLVLRSAAGAALFNTGTWGRAAPVLSVQNQGFAVLTVAGKPVWFSPGATMFGGQTLVAGDALYSPNRAYTLTMQADGNLALRRGVVVIWTSGTQGNPGARAIMQTDGNFVVYSNKFAALFSTETWHYARSQIALSNDGNLVVSLAGRPVWSRVDGSAATGQAVAAAYAYGRARGERVAAAVFDRRTQRFYLAGDVDSYYASASVMKVFIATKLLVSGQSRNSAVAGQMWRMVTLSDDNAANYLYGLVGGASVATWAAARYHLPGIAASRNPPYWGLTAITARAMVRYYAAVAADPAVGPWLLNAMANMHSPAADGWPQAFGIPSVTNGWRVKQGWMCCLDNRTRMHSTGFVNGDRYTVALLSEGSTAIYGTYGRDTVTGMAARLLPHGVIPY